MVTSARATTGSPLAVARLAVAAGLWLGLGAAAVGAAPRPAPLPVRSLPWVRGAPLPDRSGIGIDVELKPEDLDPRITSIALVVDRTDGEAGTLVRMSCDAGRILREVERGMFDVARRSELATADRTLRLLVPRAELGALRKFGLQVCARIGGVLVKENDAHAQVLSLEEDPWDPASDQARIATPSGEEYKEVIRRGHAVLSYSPTKGAVTEARVRALHPTKARDMTLRLADGRKVATPGSRRYWLAERGGLQPASALVAGDVLLGAGLRPVRVASVNKTWTNSATANELLVDGSGLYFIDGLLAAGPVGAAAGRLAARANKPVAAPRPEPAAELAEGGVALVAEPMSWDCQLGATLTLARGLPPELARAEGIDVVVAPHRGAPGTRAARTCDSGQVMARLPRALLTAASQARGRRPDEPVAFGLTLSGGVIECDGGYDLLPCVRRGDGALAALTPSARFGRAGSTCLAAGTLIDTTAGPLPIESLQVGQALRAFDIARGTETTTRIEHIAVRTGQPVATFRLSDGSELRATAEHLLWAADAGRWLRARDVAAGATLLRRDGGLVRVLARGGFDEQATVYDVTVGPPHTYFAAGVLVHNY